MQLRAAAAALLALLTAANSSSLAGAAELDCAPLSRGGTTAAAEIPYGEGLLWRLTSADGAVSHLFGTIHLSDPRVVELPGAVQQAFDDAASFTMEMVMDPLTILGLAERMYYADGARLADQLGRPLYERTAALLSQYGIPAAIAERLKPWAAYTTLAVPPAHGALPLDLRLLTAAELAAKPVFGLETMEEQMAVFESMPVADQVDLLTEAVCHYEAIQAEAEAVIDLYVARDLAGVMRVATSYDSPLHLRFMDTLLWDRNARMAQRMSERLQEGGAFIAVGALHLPGERGLLSLLDGRGYTLERVY